MVPVQSTSPNCPVNTLLSDSAFLMCSVPSDACLFSALLQSLIVMGTSSSNNPSIPHGFMSHYSRTDFPQVVWSLSQAVAENYITEILHFHCTQIDLIGPCILQPQDLWLTQALWLRVQKFFPIKQFRCWVFAGYHSFFLGLSACWIMDFPF